MLEAGTLPRQSFKDKVLAAGRHLQPTNTITHLLIPAMPSQRALIGTYNDPLPHTPGTGPGIVFVDVSDTGEMSLIGDPLLIRNPSFLCHGASHNEHVYAISEICDHPNTHHTPDGCVSALQADWANAQLTHQQTVSSCGPGPAWCHMDTTGKHLLVAGYVSGNVVLYPVQENGRLASPVACHNRTGSGPVKNRQEAPHAHAARMSPDGRWLYVADLGTDDIAAYLPPEGPQGSRLKEQSVTQADLRKKFEPIANAGTATPPGAGPRHILFTQDGKHLLAVFELSGEIAAYAYHPISGKLELICQQPSAAHPCGLTRQPSEIALSQDNQFVYIANRLIDQIACFHLTEEAILKPIADTACSKTPRHIAITPDQKLLIVACQEDNQLQSFYRNPKTGHLTPTGHHLSIGCPNFVLFANA